MEMEDERNDIEETDKIGFKDLMAIMIAQFQILMPIFLVGLFIMFLILLFVMKVWLKA